MSYFSGRAFALPTNAPLNNVLSSSSTPFHDCIESENATWTDCRAAAVNGVIASRRGYYNRPQGGFTQQGAGPVATSKVNLYLGIFLAGAQALDPTIDITQLAIDLCEKGIGHLTGDKGCTAQRKAGVIVSHNSVNSGAINWAPNGQTPQFDNTGVNCGNCFMNMIMEASSIVDKDGKTGIPEDAPPSEG